jgi:two-component system LytT family response regulator
MNKLKSLIIDDEPDAIKTLREVIEKHCKDVKIIGEADSVENAINQIEELKPNLLFLDVELKDGTGFDILKRVSYKKFVTIFISAHNHYSIQAFKFSAVDYLLKPVDISELCNAVERAMYYQNPSTMDTFRNYEVLLENLNTTSPKKFAIPTSEGLEYINIDDIILIKADGSYSELFFSGGKHKLVSKVLKDFHERLYDHGFFRSHNSFLVNLRHVKKFLKKDGGCIEMSDGSIAYISRKNIDIFKQVMNKYTLTT